jgi:thiamine pyrophosphate-dependent acetolactate synthase large subunit-like protein
MTSQTNTAKLNRRQFVQDILADRKDALIITGLGNPTYDVAAVEDHIENFYLWGAMGLAVSVGLGVAISQPQRRVVVITGDGEAMMGVGSFATVAAAACQNLSILVLDNEVFAETGNQPGLTQGCTDIEKMARGAGIVATLTATSPQHLGQVRELLFTTKGPCLVVAKISNVEEKRVLPPRNGAYMAERFRRGLGIEA